MKYGICHLSMAPCRAEASDKSEMVTQLLFGESLKVYEKKRSWYRIKTAFDNYECWIDEKQFQFISQREFEQLKEGKSHSVSDLVQVIVAEKDQSITTLLMGSDLPFLSNGICSFNGLQFKFDGNSIASDVKPRKEDISEHSLMYLNAPYLWGGRSPFGIDCSGFVQLIYKLSGMKLPRDASQQANVGQTLSFIEEAEEGDLAFFDNDEGLIVHVGIILSNNRIIHASGQVRIDRIDHQGIYNVDTKRYSHRLRLIKSVF